MLVGLVLLTTTKELIMELFTNALIITIGILAGAFIVLVAYNTLHLILNGATRWAEKKQQAARRAMERQRYEERMETIMAQAAKELERTEVHYVVTQLMDHPWMEGASKKARENNKIRNRYLAELRKLVGNSSVRRCLYEGRLAA